MRCLVERFVPGALHYRTMTDGEETGSDREAPSTDEAFRNEEGAGTEEGAGATWDPDDYEGDHSFVYEYGADLLELLAPEGGEHVLDLGCGTGNLTAELEERGTEAVGVDASREMIDRARSNHPGPRFVRGDARSLPFDGTFDAVLSNAALHWIPAADQAALLGSVRDLLRANGRIVAEMGGAGNVATIVDAVHAELAARGYATVHPWYFPCVGEYTRRLENSGFEVRFARLFDRPTDLDGGVDGLANWLGMFGDALLAPVPEGEREAVVAAVVDQLRPALFADGCWTVDYRRLRFVAVRDDID